MRCKRDEKRTRYKRVRLVVLITLTRLLKPFF